MRRSRLRRPEERGFAPGTCSEIVQFRSADGRWMAYAHRYVFPDGTASRFDPKRVRYGVRG